MCSKHNVSKVTLCLEGFDGELEKIAVELGNLPIVLDLAGLGALTAPTAYHMSTRKHLKEKARDIIEVGGLGALMGASAMHLLKHVK